MAANGVGVPTDIILSGAGVSAQTVNAVYLVTLSLGGTSTVAVTSAVKDIAGNTGNYVGAITQTSYNTNVATVSGGTITAVAKGQAIVEFACPFGDADGTISPNNGKVYTYMQVTVTA